ncbi:hypothetical protein EMCRGX_G006019 [Ephydatia muelleri]
MATMLAQLYRLLQAKIPWNWTQKEKMAFENSKNLLLSAKVLVHYDPNEELILACDASFYGVGAVLSHKMPDGTERPIAFASRTLSSAEKNYSQLEKEGLACIFGVKRFHLYLYGRNFTIVTDHKPLLQLFDPQRGIPMQVSGRIQRWIMTLAVYKYKLVFKKTEEHGNADALSRLPMDGKQIEEEEEIPTELVLLFESLKDSPVDCSQVKHWTKKDPILSQVLQYILAGWPLHPPSGASQTLLSFWQRRMELSTHDGLSGSKTITTSGSLTTLSAPYHPSSNGMAERAVQTVKQGVKKMTTGTLRDKLARFLFQYRITPQTTTGVSPAELLYGRRLRSRLDALHPNLAERVERRQQGQKAAHDTNAVERSFQEQESVYVKYYARGGRWKWVPGKITKCKGPLSFDVVLENGIVCRRHQDQLRKRAGEADDTWMGDRLSTDVAAEDPELNNGAQDEQEEDANYSVVGDEPEVDEEIDQEARPPVIVQQAPDRRYPSRNRRQPERYQAGFLEKEERCDN